MSLRLLLKWLELPVGWIVIWSSWQRPVTMRERLSDNADNGAITEEGGTDTWGGRSIPDKIIRVSGSSCAWSWDKSTRNFSVVWVKSFLFVFTKGRLSCILFPAFERLLKVKRVAGAGENRWICGGGGWGGAKSRMLWAKLCCLKIHMLKS